VSSKRQKREEANDPNRFFAFRDIFEGAAGMAKLFGEKSKHWYAKPVASNYLLYSEPSKVAGQKFATPVAITPQCFRTCQIIPFLARGAGSNPAAHQWACQRIPCIGAARAVSVSRSVPTSAKHRQ